MVFATLRFGSVLFFRLLGRVLFYFFKKRRLVALANVTKCYDFIFKSAKPNSLLARYKIRRLVKKSFAGLGQNLSDFLLLRWYTKNNIDRYISIHNIEHLKVARAKGCGVIISTAHFGSWELAAHYLALKGFESVIIYNKFKAVPRIDAWVKNQRERVGNTLILKQNSFLTLFKQLKNGGIVTLMTDQHAFPPEGISVPFLGVDVWMHAAFVKMSIKTGAPIVPAYMVVKDYLRYVIEFGKPIDPDEYVQHSDPVYAMTLACSKALEKAIITNPELWMWQHRRFKRVEI